MEMKEQPKLHQKRIIQLSKARMIRTESVTKNRISKVVASQMQHLISLISGGKHSKVEVFSQQKLL